MKQITLLLISALFVFSACTKKYSPPEEKLEIVYKKDGVQEKLTPVYCSIQSNTTMPGKTDFMLSGRSADYKTSFAISIQVTGNIIPGTYETIIASGHYPVIADYFLNEGTADEKDYTIDQAPGLPNGQFAITITSITGDIIKGTFSGNYLYDRNYDESIAITEGSFTAKKR